MTVENLHDAIGQLPSDLITAVDLKRSRKPKVIPFKRYAAIAACVAMMLCGTWIFAMTQASGGSTEAAAEAPEMMQAADSVTHSAVNAPAAAEPESEAAPMEAAPKAPAAVAGESGAGEPEEEISAENTLLHFDYPINIHAIQYADTQNIGSSSSTSQPEIRLLHSQAELEAFCEDFGYYDLESFNTLCKNYDEGWFELHDLLIVLMKDLSANSITKVTAMLDVDDNGIWELCISYTIPYEDSPQRTDRFILMEAEKNAISNEESIVLILE